MERWLINLGRAGLRIHSDQPARNSRYSTPHATVNRIRGHAVSPRHVDLLIHIRIELAIPVDIEIGPAPSLRGLLIPGLIQHTGFHPPDRRVAVAFQYSSLPQYGDGCGMLWGLLDGVPSSAKGNLNSNTLFLMGSRTRKPSLPVRSID